MGSFFRFSLADQVKEAGIENYPCKEPLFTVQYRGSISGWSSHLVRLAWGLGKIVSLGLQCSDLAEAS